MLTRSRYQNNVIHYHQIWKIMAWQKQKAKEKKTNVAFNGYLLSIDLIALRLDAFGAILSCSAILTCGSQVFFCQVDSDVEHFSFSLSFCLVPPFAGPAAKFLQRVFAFLLVNNVLHLDMHNDGHLKQFSSRNACKDKVIYIQMMRTGKHITDRHTIRYFRQSYHPTVNVINQRQMLSTNGKCYQLIANRKHLN